MKIKINLVIISGYYLVLSLAVFAKLSFATDCLDTCKVKDSNCYCNNCDKFNDCCEDAYNTNQTNRKFQDYYKCTQYNKNGYVYVISKCNPNWPLDQIKTRCLYESNEQQITHKNLLLKLPVYSLKINFTYKNIYCAKCNYESIDKLLFYKLSYFTINQTLSTPNDIVDVCLINNIKNDKCGLSVELPNNTLPIRTCINAIDTCPVNSSSELVEKCSNFTSYTYYKTDMRNGYRAFKNKYCAICNGIEEKFLECKINIGRSAPVPFMHSLQLLFDLSDLNGQVYVALKTSQSNAQITNADCNTNTTSNQLMCSQELNSVLNDIKNETLISKNQVNDVSINDKIKSYITFIGNLISIISLFLLLIIYSLLKNLRNLAGKILMSLSIALLLAQIFFLISMYTPKINLNIKFISINNNFTLCYLLGLLIHYFLLSFFSWSNVMSYDLFKVFTIFTSDRFTTQQFNQSSNKAKFIKYSLYAWFLPIAIITILLLTQLFRNDYTQLYGLYVCFLTYKLDLMIFFVIPTAIILVLNLTFFILSSFAIYKVQKSTKMFIKNRCNSSSNDTNTSLLTKDTQASLKQSKYSRKSNNTKTNSIDKPSNITISTSTDGDQTNDKKYNFEIKRFILFVKLFVLMGITWIIGVLNSYHANTFIAYIYIIVNSLQGFFIFLTIIFNRQTIKEMSHHRLLRPFTFICKCKN